METKIEEAVNTRSKTKIIAGAAFFVGAGAFAFILFRFAEPTGDPVDDGGYTPPPARITVSGKVFTDEGVTALANSGGQVKIVNNATGVAYSDSDGTDASGNWTISMPTPTVGSVFTIWMNDAPADSTLALKYGSACSGYPNCTGLSLYQNRVILRNENTGDLSNADFANCDQDSGTNCADQEIGFTSNSGSFRSTARHELHIWTGDSFLPRGILATSGTTIPANPEGDLHIDTGASLNSEANSLTIGGDLINNGVIAGKPIMTSSASGLTITPGTSTYALLGFNGSGKWQFTSGTLTIDDVLIGNSATVDFSNLGEIHVRKGWSNNLGTATIGNATVYFDGNTSTSIASNCTNVDTCTNSFNNIIVNKTNPSDTDDNVKVGFNIRVTGTITVMDGELLETADMRVEGTPAMTISTAGKWTYRSIGTIKLGGDVSNSGEIVLDGNSTVCSPTFNQLNIRSTQSGMQRLWNGSGTFTIEDVSVWDMSGTVEARSSTNVSNTTWSFVSCP